MSFRVKKPIAAALLALVAACICAQLGWVTAGAEPSFSGLSGDDVINHLNAVIGWYHDVTLNIQPTGLPIDAIYQQNAEGMAADAVRAAFESARQEAPMILAGDKNPDASAAGATPGSTASQNVAKVQARIAALETQIASLNKQIAAASAKKKPDLLKQRDALQGQLDLNNEVLDTLEKVADFNEGQGGSVAGGILGNINRLAQTLPEVMGKPSAQKPATPANAPLGVRTSSGGLVQQAFGLYSVVKTLRQIDAVVNETDRVQAAASQVRKPLRDALRWIAQQGQSGVGGGQSAQAQGVQTQPQAAPAPVPSLDYDALTRQFKQLAGATLPLNQEIRLLEQSKTNLLDWRRTIVRESGTSFRSLVFHALVIGGALAIVLVLSEVWRRFTFRYIKDARRRRQFLVLRRFVIGFLMGIILILGFVSQFSSLATFAGFVTAGIAVGLQAVLLSVAAYFFLIGRWGIRVGDRVSVSGVTGDVIDVGLVRFYMMELAGTGIDLYQTGRIVVFANSVLFQANTPLFKQIPGTEYTWHEVGVALAANANYKAVQDWLTKTVEAVYARYRGEIDRQHEAIEERFDLRLTVPTTEGRLQLTDGGLEYTVRYPVEIGRAAEIDEEITRTVLESLEKDTSLKESVPNVPRIRAAVRG